MGSKEAGYLWGSGSILDHAWETARSCSIVNSGLVKSTCWSFANTAVRGNHLLDSMFENARQCAPLSGNAWIYASFPQSTEEFFSCFFSSLRIFTFTFSSFNSDPSPSSISKSCKVFPAFSLLFLFTFSVVSSSSALLKSRHASASINHKTVTPPCFMYA